MAGQPRKKAIQASLLGDTAYEAYKQVRAICPDQYLDIDKVFSPSDKTAWAWRGTITKARSLVVEAEQLELLLCRKAELPTPDKRDEAVYEDDPWEFPEVQRLAALNDAEQVEEDSVVIEGNCSIIESIHWVIESLEKPNVKKQEAPSNTAWTLYKWAKSNPVNKAEFINKSWGKLIPSNKQIENDARMQDDASSILELIESIREAGLVD